MTRFPTTRPSVSSSVAITAGLTAGLYNPLAIRIGIMHRTEAAYAGRGMRLVRVEADHLYTTLCSWSEPSHRNHPLFHAVAHLPETMLPMEFVTVLMYLDALPRASLDFFGHLFGVSAGMVDDSLIASAALVLGQAFAPAEADDAPLPLVRPMLDYTAVLEGRFRYVVAAFQPSNMPPHAVRALAAGLEVIVPNA